ncbi:MAG: TolC family protein [Candidatus Binatia bacterium]
MKKKCLSFLAVALAIGLAGCGTPNTQAVWPELRPLGKDLPTFQPPVQPPPLAVIRNQVGEPTGALTLRQALALALMQNPELAAFAWEVRAGEARTLQAGLIPNPEIGVEVENFAGSRELRGFRGSETTVQFSQLIELGGKRLKRRRVAGLERDLAAWDYETKRLDVFTRVAQSFVQVLSDQERVAANEELVRLAEQVLETVAERVQAGKVSPVEETRAKVALSSSRIALERARRQLDAARKALAATWGSTKVTFERAEGNLDVIAAIPTAEQVAQRVQQNPDLARWVTEIAQREAAVDLEGARRIPDLTVGVGPKYFNETNNQAMMMEFSIPLPFFDRNQGGYLEARYRLAKASEERRAAETQVRATLGQAYAALSAAYGAATALRDEVLPGAGSAFEAASEGYRQGKFGILDVLDAQRTLFEAKSQYIEALAAYHNAVAQVERLIGEPLSAVNTPVQP